MTRPLAPFNGPAGLPAPPLQWQQWEQRFGPIRTAVIARRPGANLRSIGVVLLAVGVFGVVAYAISRATGYTLVSYLPLALLGAIRPRSRAATPSDVPLPYMVYVVVTGDSVVFAYYRALYSDIGDEVFRLPYRDVETVTRGAWRNHVVVGVTDGRTATVSVGRPRDRRRLVEVLTDITKHHAPVEAADGDRHRRPTGERARRAPRPVHPRDREPG